MFDEHEPNARPHLIDAHTFITYEKQIGNLQLQEARLARRREKEIAELRSVQNERTGHLVPVVRAQESRIQKQQSQTPELSGDGFVFSTEQIERDSEVSMLLPPDSWLLALEPR